LDALRYDCIMFNWHDTAVDRRQYTARKSGVNSGNNNRRKVRIGGGSVQSF